MTHEDGRRHSGLPTEDVLGEVLRRVGSSGWVRFSVQLAHTGGCARPVRLKGALKRADLTTGELQLVYDSAGEPDGVLLKTCQSRRATRCPACAAVYKSDARQLVLAGLVGGKGTGPEVANRPLVFVTLTAPSFGPVHAERADSEACHPEHFDCACGTQHGCHEHHVPGDRSVGAPLCGKTYDYKGVVVWNNRAGELWRRTMIAARRDVAKYVGLSERGFNARYRLAYVKVVEYQARGVIHVHALVRLDRAHCADAEPLWQLSGALVAAISRAASGTVAPNPLPGHTPIGWGAQSRVDPVAAEERERLAGYLAKYTTKSVDDAGALDHRLKRGELAGLTLDAHLRRLVKAAWDLGGRPAFRQYRLREWAHTLGYRGHWLTKSPNWSTTLGALRQARYDYQVARAGENDHEGITIGEWAYSGTGHESEGDVWLAEAYRKNRHLNRRTRWEEA